MAQAEFPTEGVVLTHLFVVSDLDRSRHFYRDVLGASVFCGIVYSNFPFSTKPGSAQMPSIYLLKAFLIKSHDANTPTNFLNSIQMMLNNRFLNATRQFRREYHLWEGYATSDYMSTGSAEEPPNRSKLKGTLLLLREIVCRSPVNRSPIDIWEEGYTLSSHNRGCLITEKQEQIYAIWMPSNSRPLREWSRSGSSLRERTRCSSK